jgi:hypothetical protein
VLGLADSKFKGDELTERRAVSYVVEISHPDSKIVSFGKVYNSGAFGFETGDTFGFGFSLHGTWDA